MELRSSRLPVAALAALAALVLGACAGNPHSSTAAPGEPEPVAAAPAPATPSAPGAGNSDNPFPGTITRKGPNGQTLYCRRDEVAGTRIPQLVCATEAVMRSREEESRRMIDEARTISGLGGCDPSAGC